MKKIFVPWLMLIIIQMAIPEASFIGHLTGILAALLLRFTLLKLKPNHGLYPRRVLQCLRPCEDRCHGCVGRIERRVTYYRA